MDHYQKLAVLLFRLIGLTFAVSMSIALALHIVLYRAYGGQNTVELVSALLYLLLGILLTVLSRPLSRLVVRGFKDE